MARRVGCVGERQDRKGDNAVSAKIANALHEVMSKVSYVQKTGKNAFHGYKYAGEADLLAVLRPAMVDAGLMLLPSVKSVSPVDEYGNVSVLMEYSLVHRDGEVWPEKIGAAGMGNDKAKNGSVGDKGVYKAITGANKYVLFKLFQIETGDDPEASDNAHETPNTVTGPAIRQSSAALKRDGAWQKLMFQLSADFGDCKSMVTLSKLRADYRQRAREEGWPKAWLEALANEFDQFEESLPKVDDDDTFPGDLPSNTKPPVNNLRAG
jgi:hypothetical protein